MKQNIYSSAQLPYLPLRPFRRRTRRPLIILLFTILWTSYLIKTGYSILVPSRWSLPSARYERHPVDEALPKGKPSALQRSHEPVDIVVPQGVKVIGLVFYGRREFVKILDCYLKRNLKDNGGILDQVIFAVNTEDENDLAYLEKLLLSHPRYSKYVVQKEYKYWLGSWKAVSESENIYVKIDDDVLFFEDTTIPAIVKRTLENPQYFAVSANVVNSPVLSWVHYRMGVYRPYWPEMSPPTTSPPASWRASDLPSFKGLLKGSPDFHFDGTTPAPYKGHRWLPIRLPHVQEFNTSLFPASTLAFSHFGPSRENWAAAAQTHYSFLHHLEQDDIWRYKFDTWDFIYERLSINFFAVRGRDIMDVFPFPEEDDEYYLTVRRPKELGRHVVVDGTGLAVHFAFQPQYMVHDWRGLDWTDLLGRYSEYAKEMACLKL